MAAAGTSWTRRMGAVLLVLGLGASATTAQLVTGNARPKGPLARPAPDPGGWVRHLGGSQTDSAQDLALLPGGGAIACGRSASGAGGGTDAWVARLSELGEALWQRTLGDTGTEDAQALCALDDGGCLVAGRTSSHGAGGLDGSLTRLDADGEVIWMRTYGTALDDEFTSLSAAPGGDAFYVGGVLTDPVSGLDAWVLKVDGAGDVLWQQRFAGSRNEGVNDLDTTLDGGVVLTADSNSIFGLPESASSGVAFFRPFVVRLAADGSIVHQRTFDYSGGDSFRRIVALDSGGFLAVGEILATGFFGGDLWVVRLDEQMAPLWERRLGDHFGINSGDRGVAVAPTPDGGFAVLASTATAGAGFEDLWYVRLAADGALLTDTTLGGVGFDQAGDLAVRGNGAAWIAGQVQLGVGGNIDALVMRLPLDGDLDGCQLMSRTAPGSWNDTLQVDEVFAPGVATAVVPGDVPGAVSTPLLGVGACLEP